MSEDSSADAIGRIMGITGSEARATLEGMYGADIAAGVIGIGLIAGGLSLCFIAGVASTWVAAALNFSTISRGVLDGMNTPYQMVRSEFG